MEDVAPRLLACLQRTLQERALTYAEPPAVLAGGYDTAVYAFQLHGGPPEWSARLVLRVYRPDTQRRDLPRFEAAVHGCIADAGLPVPRVLLVVDGASELERPFLVMERAPGRNLVGWLASPAVVRLPRWLAETQLALHAVPPATLERALAAAGIDAKPLRLDAELREVARALDTAALAGLRDGAAWLERQRPAEASLAICHGDFHPLNILADGRRVTGLIDWARVHVAEPEYDVGGTLTLIRDGPLRVPALLEPLANAARKLLCAAYLADYRRRRPLDPARLRWYQALRLMLFLVEEGVEQAAEVAGRSRSSKRSVLEEGAQQLRVAARFAALTGVRVTLPSGPTRSER